VSSPGGQAFRPRRSATTSSSASWPRQRGPSGYRAYDETALGRLGFVRAARALGLSLGEIRQVVAFRDDGVAPCEHVTALPQRRAADLARRIAELEQLRGALDRLADGGLTRSR
jgi:MerR family copper efflux transcriptional regulator